MKIKFDKAYQEMGQQACDSKDSHHEYYGCGSRHNEKELEDCKECWRISNVVAQKKAKIIEDMWNDMGNAQIEYKEKIEKKLAAEKNG